MSITMHCLPDDVMILIMQYLSPQDLAALERICRAVFDLVEEFGWKQCVRLDKRPSYSLSRSFSTWSSRGQVQYTTVADNNWSSAQFIARPLSQRWHGKLQPLLAINSSRLLLAAGSLIYSYGFGYSSSHEEAPRVYMESTYTTGTHNPTRDITGLASVPDLDDRTAYVGYTDGSLERINLPPHKPTTSAAEVSLVDRYRFHGGSLIESISVSSTHMLSLSSAGLAALMPLTTSDPSPQLIDLGMRSWVAHLSTRSSASYAAFGTTSRCPLAIHNISTSHLSPHPSTLLAPGSQMDRPSAVYAIESAPMSSPWGASDQIVVSGWYDGMVRVHDLRSSARTTANPTGGAPMSALLPTLSFSDPWSYEPIYSLACGGGSTAHIAAGSARHSVVAFWDIRSPGKGWSMHAPGNDSSPVYSLIVDGPRVFGANESRGFVLDFGMGVSEQTYPPIVPDTIRRRRGGVLGVDDGMKRIGKGGVGIYVTKYTHHKLA